MTEIDTRIDVGPDVEMDEFDLDLRLGELATWRPGHPTHVLVDAQSDGVCLPTGGRGAGGTCDTQNNTCPGTCAGLGTCPATACGATCDTCPRTQCGATCPRTDCGATCPRTDCGNTCADFTNCGGTCANTHCFTCRSGCRPP